MNLRLPVGGLIDRSKPLRFYFDRRAYGGFAGDTLASALLANGVRLVGRSFKYHRPRGILAAGAEEPNALVELRTGARREPNTRATTSELYEGLRAASQNRFPSLSFDILSMTAPFGALMHAGFYYKTFMWPAKFWERVYEPLIRRSAGLGRAGDGEDPDHYEQANAFCDVLVIGGGAAGLSAALAAGRAGARVVLCDDDFRFGGRLLAERREIDGRDAGEWLISALAELASLPEVRLMPRTTVFGVYDHGTYGAVERVGDHLSVPPPHEPRQRLWRIVAREAVLAAGAIEQPAVFDGNDRPGVMLAGAVRTYLNRFAVAPGRNAVVLTSTDEGWRTASDLAGAGIAVAAIIDTRREIDPRLRKLSDARVVSGGAITGTRSGRGLGGISVRDATTGRREWIACDLLAMSSGWQPALHLTCHLGGKPQWDAAKGFFVPGRVPPGMRVAGAASGAILLADALADGWRSGAEAAAGCGFPITAPPPRSTTDPESNGAWMAQSTGAGGKAFVDFQNDVTAADVALAHREGFRSVEHLKRYTTLGMATDQGKTANLAGLSLMAGLLGRSIQETGTTVFRPPYTPVAIGALAGHHRGRDYRPTRLTPSHDWASERGAVFVETGLWLRAQYFPHPDDVGWQTAVDREVSAVRAGVGVCDVSTLGKIDIQGADAVAFLERVYCNGWATLPVGKARYGLMLREDGFVMDDGTTSRLGPAHFYMTTTTANAAHVLQHLEFCHQVLFPEFDVQMVSVSEQWAQFSIAGPRSRDVVLSLVDREHDVSDAAFPHLASREVTVGGIPARLFRISFSGELAYEIAVAAGFGDAAIRAIMSAGEPFGIVPYGTEALGVMRIEKGHVAGNEINGQTTARDLGLGRMMSAKKDYIGRVMAQRPALLEPDRPMLAGFRPVDRTRRLHAGAHFVGVGKAMVTANDEGYMTSVAHSPSLGHWIGLGLIRRGPARIGERVRAVDPVRGNDVEVEICNPTFVDPEGKRIHG